MLCVQYSSKYNGMPLLPEVWGHYTSYSCIFNNRVGIYDLHLFQFHLKFNSQYFGHCFNTLNVGELTKLGEGDKNCLFQHLHYISLNYYGTIKNNIFCPNNYIL